MKIRIGQIEFSDLTWPELQKLVWHFGHYPDDRAASTKARTIPIRPTMPVGSKPEPKLEKPTFAWKKDEQAVAHVAGSIVQSSTVKEDLSSNTGERIRARIGGDDYRLVRVVGTHGFMVHVQDLALGSIHFIKPEAIHADDRERATALAAGCHTDELHWPDGTKATEDELTDPAA